MTMTITREQVDALPEDVQTLVEAGYVDQCDLLPTDRGIKQLNRILFAEKATRKQLVDLAQERIDKQKEKAAKTKKA